MWLVGNGDGVIEGLRGKSSMNPFPASVILFPSDLMAKTSRMRSSNPTLVWAWGLELSGRAVLANLQLLPT